MAKPTMIKLFAKARLEFEQSADQVAATIKTDDGVGISREYLYEVLKYPNKNPDIFRQACEYIKSAGVILPDDPKINLKARTA